MECSKWLTGPDIKPCEVCCNLSFYELSAVKTVNPSSHSILGVLIGNKNEYRLGVVDSRTEVTFQEGQQAAGELGLAYFETSAVCSAMISRHPDLLFKALLVVQEMPNGVDEPFKYIAQEFYQKYVADYLITEPVNIS